MSLPKSLARRLVPATWFRRRPRQPARSQPRRRLAVEPLEDRIAPALDMLDVAGLRFLSSNGFHVDPSDRYIVNTGTVAIGYTPAGTEDFLPLVQVRLLGTTDPFDELFVLTPHDPQPSFELFKNLELDLVAVGGSPSVPIPIWKLSDTIIATGTTFDIGKLQSSGVELDPRHGQYEPVEVAKVEFFLRTLLFHNPGGGTTDDAQVRMQGDVSFDKVPLLQNAGITAHVGGPNDPQNNYVIADHSGITLTGLDVTKELPSNLKLAGLAVSGTVTIGYTHADNSFSFGGMVHLTSQSQGLGQDAALNNVSAGIELAVTTGQVVHLGFSLGGSFKIFDLNVSTINGEPLTFALDLTNLQQHRYEISGGLQLEFNGNKLSAELDDGMGGPGILLENGRLTQFHAVFNADIHLFGATINATNLTFEYEADNGHGQSQFQMYGDLSLMIPTSGAGTTITARLGTEADPGLILQDGTLTQINMGLSGAFNVFGFRIEAVGANLRWHSEDNSFLISGAFRADFRVFQAALTLGDSPTTGLIIKDGHFQIQSARFELNNARLGPVTLKQLLVQWQQSSPGNFQITVAGMAALPGGWEVDAELVFNQAGLDAIAVSVTAGGDGIPLANTGLFVTELGGSIKNLENPAQIVVTAHMAVTWGKTFSILGQEVKLFRAEGNITVDANQLILSGSVQIGAYSSDGGTNWQGVLGEGNAQLSLDWGDQIYSLHVDVIGLAGIFSLRGDLTFTAGEQIRFLAQASVVVPSQVPFIGGQTLGGLGFYFEHVFPRDNISASTTFAAWAELHIIWDFEVGFQLVFDAAHPSGSFSLIGSDRINNFKAESMPPVGQTYTYSIDLAGVVPGPSASVTLSADWSKPAAGVTIVGRPKFRVQRTLNGQTQTFTEDQFAAHGIQIMTDPRFNTPVAKAIQIVGSTTDPYAPITGAYKLLVDVTAEGGNPFPNLGQPGTMQGTTPGDLEVQTSYYVPKPTFGARDAPAPYVPSVPPTPSGAFQVNLTGTMAEGFLTASPSRAEVSLYRVLVQDPEQNPVLIGTVTPTQVSGPNWQAAVTVPIDGLYPLPYTVFAVIKDGFNAPVTTASSAPFTPDFAVVGTVSNQAHDALTGWPVFLDYNQNGVHEADEPIYPTSNPGGFFAFTPTFDPSTGWRDIPADGTPFNVQLIVQDPQHFAPVAPDTLTYHHGERTQVVAFEVMEKTAIRGIVFEDLASGQRLGLPGWTVFLDANGNGLLDAGEASTLTDASGSYSFHDLPPNTSQTVAVQLQPFYGQTKPPPPGTYTVAVGDTPFTIYDRNDFGVAPFVTISGTVLSEPYIDGALVPLKSPLAGATVILMQDGKQIATTTSAADGSYSFPPVAPGATYEVGVFKDGWRQINPVDLAAGDYLKKLDVQLPGSRRPTPGSVAVADFNGDGVQDLAVLDTQSGLFGPSVDPPVWIYYNDPKGGGFITPPVSVATGGDLRFITPVKVVAGQFSREGLPELAVLHSDGTVTLLTNVNGTLQPGTLWVSLPSLGIFTVYHDMVAGHFFTGASSLDQLVAVGSSGFADFPNRFAPVAFGAGHNPVATTAVAGREPKLAAGDINGDGITDLFIGHLDANFGPAVPSVYYGNGTGLFTPKVMTIFSPGHTTVVGDINSDGRLDLGVFDNQGIFSYAIQDDSGAFPAAIRTDILTGSKGPGAVLADVNYDFRPDLVWVTSNARNGYPPLQVFINTGTPNAWFNPIASAGLPVPITNFYALAVASLEAPDRAPSGIGDIVVLGNPGGSGTGPQFVQVFFRDGINAPPWNILPSNQDVTGIDFVLVEVGKDARLLALVADQQVEQGATLSFRVLLTRAAAVGHRGLFSLEPGAPAGAQIDPVSGQFTWTAAVAPGQYPITVRLTDPSQPARTETVTFAVTVTPPSTGPAAEPVLADVTVKRSRKPSLRGRLQSATLIFNVPVNLDADALRLVRTKKGKPVKDLSKWIRIATVVQDGQTWARIRFRSPQGKLLPLGRYSLFVQNDLVRNTLTGAPLAGPEGSGHTEIRFSPRGLQWR